MNDAIWTPTKMDINLIQNPNQVPKPRNEIRLLEITLSPDINARTVRVTVTMTAFSPADKPSLNIIVTDMSGQEVTSMTIIESMTYELSVTTHLRNSQTIDTEYTFQVDLYFEPGKVQHSLTKTIVLSTGDNGSAQNTADPTD